MAQSIDKALVVKEYAPAFREECVALLADAFVANPLHLAAFGSGRIDRNRLFFRIGLRQMFSGTAFIALLDGAVAGYVHFNASPRCLPAPEEIPIAMATVLQPLGESIPQVIRWFTRWCRLDPDEPHLHLGPLGVAPGMQRRGVGSALMRRYVEYLDGANSAGYLETDRPENVAFYQKFGFALRRQEILINTPTWYMWRPANKTC